MLNGNLLIIYKINWFWSNYP